MKKSDEMRLHLEFGKMKAMSREKLADVIRYHSGMVEKLEKEIDSWLFRGGAYSDEQKETMRRLGWHFFLCDYGKRLQKPEVKVMRAKDLYLNASERKRESVGKKLDGEKTKRAMGEDYITPGAYDILYN